MTQPLSFARFSPARTGLTLSLAACLLAAAPAHAAPNGQQGPASHSQAAASRGTVQSVQAVQVKGEGSGVGIAAGAVVGGLVGNQMGKGTGNTLMTVGGAVAGGFAGNEVEKHVKKHTVYKTRVKLDNGQTREFTVGERFAVGARVHVDGKKLTLAP
ncbi:MAG TPA: glycine zipper 2TM domain-containing protein [Aquabacterium sp.]|nr:glycine zipper 2TM domain-containing protein [Aquabacterium sp.]